MLNSSLLLGYFAFCGLYGSFIDHHFTIFYTKFAGSVGELEKKQRKIREEALIL
ncbi:hypothetical protein [Anaerospora sp.]|uniref:hypothetical protein n=1 Tax=Anaerospora sp. TaxID=1960278 RepID=UPI00289F9FC0|nr:hypothetical protein [Anaerospora sp.]